MIDCVYRLKKFVLQGSPGPSEFVGCWAEAGWRVCLGVVFLQTGRERPRVWHRVATFGARPRRRQQGGCPANRPLTSHSGHSRRQVIRYTHTHTLNIFNTRTTWYSIQIIYTNIYIETGTVKICNIIRWNMQRYAVKYGKINFFNALKNKNLKSKRLNI